MTARTRTVSINRFFYSISVMLLSSDFFVSSFDQNDTTKKAPCNEIKNVRNEFPEVL